MPFPSDRVLCCDTYPQRYVQWQIFMGFCYLVVVAVALEVVVVALEVVVVALECVCFIILVAVGVCVSFHFVSFIILLQYY